MTFFHSRSYLLAVFTLLALPFVFSGCGAAPGTTGGSGYGADAGPWPTAPTRNTNGGQVSPNDPPKVPLIVTVRATASPDEELALSISKIELKYENNIASVVGKEAIAQLTPMPLRAGDKGHVALLATTTLPRRNYTTLLITFDNAKTTLKQKTGVTIPLSVLGATQDLGEWAMSTTEPNLLAIAIDGTQVTTTAKSASLPANALTVVKGVPAGSISGKLSPAVDNARVEVFWASTKASFGQMVTPVQDGSFNIGHLPAGEYTISITASGHRLAESMKKPVVVGEKPVDLGTLQLVEDQR